MKLKTVLYEQDLELNFKFTTDIKGEKGKGKRDVTFKVYNVTDNFAEFKKAYEETKGTKRVYIIIDKSTARAIINNESLDEKYFVDKLKEKGFPIKSIEEGKYTLGDFEKYKNRFKIHGRGTFDGNKFYISSTRSNLDAFKTYLKDFLNERVNPLHQIVLDKQKEIEKEEHKKGVKGSASEKNFRKYREQVREKEILNNKEYLKVKEDTKKIFEEFKILEEVTGNHSNVIVEDITSIERAELSLIKDRVRFIFGEL